MSDIVNNARTALLMMNQRGLPPTPENYTKTFNEVAGIVDSAPAHQHDAPKTKGSFEQNRKLIRDLGELLTGIATGTGDHAEKLDRQSKAIRQCIADLQKSGDELQIASAFQPVLTLLNATRQSVSGAPADTTGANRSTSSVASPSKQPTLIDPLTGLRNRVNMESTISQERAQAKSSETKLSIATLDIDRFKVVYDSLGKDVGDKLLVHFAEALRSVARNSDVMFHHGRDQFLLLMPETDRATAEQIAQKLRDTLAKNPPVNPQDTSKRIPITFSAGVAELTQDDDAQSLVARADKALHLAKQRGRDCVVNDLQLEGTPTTPQAAPSTSKEAPPETSPFPPPTLPPKAAKVPKAKPSGKLVPLDDEMVYLGRLPVLHKDQELFGYDLSLFASQLGREQLPAQLSDLSNYLGKLGVERATSDHQGFVTATRDDLMSNDIKRLAGDKLVLEITDVSELDQKALARCMELKERGFKLSLADYFDQPVYDAVLKLFDFVKLDVYATSNFEMRNAINRLEEFNQIHRIAKHVDTLGTFERCMDLEFSLIQGNFFVHSEAATMGNANPEQTTLLVVLGQLLTDVDLPRIERAFQGHDELTVNLLALVNSAAMGLSRKIDSLQQTLVILGRRQLMRWVQVLLYSHSDIKSAPLLMEIAATRAKLMDLLCSTHADAEKRADVYRDRAFTVGILSLTHILLGMNLMQVADQIGLDDEVRLALLEREGFLGSLLALTEKVETAEFEAAEELMRTLNVSSRELNKAQMDTLRWVYNIGKSTD